MQRNFQADWVWAIIGVMALTTDVAVAQVRPDATLGAESSRVRADRVTGRDGVTRDSDVIEGGARRGGNLFHSFEQFDVPEGRDAYFGNPADVRNIFSRVTSADRSEIFGTLGVLNGNANLFFMNPNGILFGPNASLDLGGSFAATMANAMQFENLGFFSATNPEVPSPLLTINPSAFLFNQVPVGAIINRSSASAGDERFGLRVPDGENFLFLGGDVRMRGGALNASGGRVEIGAIAEPGIVQLNLNGSLSLPNGIARSDFSLLGGGIEVRGSGGTVIIATRNIRVIGSLILAGLAKSDRGSAGNIRLDATGMVNIGRQSDIRTVSRAADQSGSGSDSGNIIISAGSLTVSQSSLLSGRIGEDAIVTGDAGDIRRPIQI